MTMMMMMTVGFGTAISQAYARNCSQFMQFVLHFRVLHSQSTRSYQHSIIYCIHWITGLSTFRRS